MSKHFEYRKMDNLINHNIYKINELIGNVKNVSIEAKLLDNKKFVIDDTIINLLSFEDSTGIINALLITDKIDCVIFKLNSYYRVRGNIVILDKDKIIDFSELISKINVVNYFVKDMKLLCVRSVQHIEVKPLITSIQLSLYHNNKNDLIELEIPISAIDLLEINKISTSIMYLKNGKYDEIVVCDCLWLRLLNSKLKKDTSKLLLEDISIFSIILLFNNGDKKYYNLPYYSNNGLKNNLQRIDKKENNIIIMLDEDLKRDYV